jgi:MFS family permease
MKESRTSPNSEQPEINPWEANTTEVSSLIGSSEQPVELSRNWLKSRSFWALVVTQFLGAFNDNVYKTTLLLLFVKVPHGVGEAGESLFRDWQGEGTFLFGLPFILFSGWAGYLSDKYSKQGIIVLCKVAEIVIMVVGLALFYFYGAGPMQFNMLALFCLVLFAMGTHSAFFGPGKYGILPEILAESALPAANGIMLMTTFLAIIFGIGLAGWLKDTFATGLWPVGIVCVIIALFGTCSSLLIQYTPALKKDLQFQWDMVAVPREIRALLRVDNPLFLSLMISSLFWLVASLVLQIVNSRGKNELQVSDFQTSLLMSGVSVGIILGAPLAGWLSHQKFNASVLKLGAWGITCCLLLLALRFNGQLLLPYAASMMCLAMLGFFTGFLSVPLQVMMQMRPPLELKGRMIATMNLGNFLGIVIAGPLYSLSQWIIANYGGQPSDAFWLPMLFMLLVGLLYHPQTIDLSHKQASE